MYFLYLIHTALGNYVGVSKNVQRRFSLHSRKQYKIGDAIRYDPDCTISILAAGDREYIYDLEAKAIKQFGTRWPEGLNIAAGGHGCRDPLPSTRAKISASVSISLLGNTRNIGRVASLETRTKMTRAQLGRQSGMLGKTHSQETRAKLSAFQKTRKRGRMSEAAKAKMRERALEPIRMAALIMRNQSRGAGVQTL